jgi:murein DD-endopeptidase MepM/ murein hydrolase activator NlpD
MALRPPVENVNISQGFGPSSLGVEPAMYFDGTRAWWNAFPGARYYPDFHAAIDYAATEGTRIVASEDGIVTQSYFDGTYGGGHKVRVQIREGTYYTSNHMASRAVAVGQRVSKGQLLGTVGHTGTAFGSHDHFELGFDDAIGSETWPVLVDPRQFMFGGSHANDPRIQPVSTVRRLIVSGPGINIRFAPPHLDETRNVFAVSRADGIYRRRDGRRISGLKYRFVFLHWRKLDGHTFAIVSGFGKQLAIAKSLVKFT